MISKFIKFRHTTNGNNKTTPNKWSFFASYLKIAIAIIPIALMSQASANSLADLIPSTTNIGSLVTTAKASQTTNTPFSTNTTTNITFDKDKIKWLLEQDGYSLTDLDNIDNPNDRVRTITATLESPISISTGCGTVEAELDEAFGLMIAAFKQQLGQLTKEYIQEAAGLPDVKNPKEVFEFIYDTTTTLLCGGETGIVQGLESAVWGSMSYIKNELDMYTDENESGSTGTQVGHGCALAAKPDEITEDVKTGVDKNADKQTEGDIQEKAATGYNSKFQKCKQAYVDYKGYISAKIKKFDIYKQKAASVNKSSCEILAGQKGVSKDYKFNNPFAKKNNTDNETVISAKSRFSTLNIKHGDNGMESEIVVNKEAIYEDLPVEGFLKKYKDSNQQLSAVVFKAGIDYANTISTCLNQYAFSESSADNNNAPAICATIDSITSPFPIKLYNPDSKKSGLIPLLETKKILCDVTLFNINEDQFIVDSIGYVIHSLGTSLNTQSLPSISDLRAATQHIILDDYCASKYKVEVQSLSAAIEQKIELKLLEIEDSMRGFIVKRDAWKANEIHFTQGTEINGKEVVKICQKYTDNNTDTDSQQSKYFIATPTEDYENTTKVKVAEVSAETFSDLKDQVDTGNLGQFLPSTFETEMLYKPPGKAVGDAITASGEYKESDLVCGINYKKSSDRKDNLYGDGGTKESPKKDSAIANYKSSLKGNPYSEKKHQKANNDELFSKLDKHFKALVVKEKKEKEILNGLSIDLLKKINNLRY